jgi:ribosomal protein S18 acetylase RimI-like enzyme
MNAYPFVVEPLGKQDRSGFSCGIEALDHYFRRQVTQDIRRRVTACYVAIEAATRGVVGYYTLSAADVPITDLSLEVARRLPRYPSVPVARIGRLAVHNEYQGKKLGAALILNAALRAARSEIAVFALVVDAKDENAKAFYRYHGFETFGSIQRQLIAPIDTFRQIIR